MTHRRIFLKQMRCRLQGQEGTGTVEFALLVSILMLLLLGMWDFARLIEAWMVTTDAAWEGARHGAIYSADQVLSQPEVVSLTQQKAYEYMQLAFGSRGDIQPYSVDNTTVGFPNGRSLGQPVQVTVSVQVDVWALIGDLFFSGSSTATIRSVATMRI